MKTALLNIVAAMVICGANAVAQATPTVLAAPAAAAVAASPGAPSDATDYKLVPNDVIQVTVFQEDDLNSMLRISRNGSITFPLIGVLNVTGKTPHEAADVIRAALAKDYLVNPQVNVTVAQYAPKRFTVLGQVQRPGAYDLPDRDSFTLIEAIGMAGGYTRIADSGRITLKRIIDGKESVVHLNAKKMANSASAASFDIMPGDIITVGESVF